MQDENINQCQREIETKNREISSISKDLERTQAMLLQQEKLASIGQLAAGVAHELNNPISYIQSNLNMLDKYISNITTLVDMLESLKEANSKSELTEKWAQIEEYRVNTDIEYILREIPALTSESLSGVERIRQIVNDLRSFSRDDGARLAETDIHTCINSALNIVWNEVKYHARVVKNFGTTPPLQCYPQQLTQVFINLLVNAAQAIPEMGEIHLTTAMEGDSVIAIVEDNGTGISVENLKKIFDPFFTTKEVGKGTGLGLSIAYGIIQRHGGKLSANSTLGVGTSFRIELPINVNYESLSENANT
jgi:two-component system, NtrC family, sensor kinase